MRIDRKRKLPATVFLRALAGIDSEKTKDEPGLLSKGTDEEILDLFDGNPFIKATLEKDSVRSVDEALVELFKKQRPGEPPTLEASRNLLWNICFDPKRYDLTRVGRHKLNARLGLNTDLDVRTLTKADIVALVRELVAVPLAIDHEHLLEEARDLAEVAPSLPWDEVANRLDEYEHFGNRRLRMVGELVQEAFRVGLYRMERVVRERMTTEDVDTITPQSIINIRPVVAALKEFYGSSQLSQFMDQTNSLAGLTHRRRLSALGAGGLTRERAPIEVRDVHPTHYGRMCPIETPEGPNIGLIGSLSSYATVNEFGFIQTPYRKVVEGKVTDEIQWLTAYEEEKHTIAQANAPLDPKTNVFVEDTVLARAPGGEYVSARARRRRLHGRLAAADRLGGDGSRALPGAQRRQPGSHGLEHAAPGSAAPAGRGAAHRHGHGISLGGGYRRRASGQDRPARCGAYRPTASSSRPTTATSSPTTCSSSSGRTRAPSSTRSRWWTWATKWSPATCWPTAPRRQDGELALGRNLLVAFMSWEGYNFEDSIVISERLVKDDVLTSVHIEEYEVEARSTKLGDEEITRDIPNRSEESLADLDEDGVVRIGAEVASGDLLVGKITPKGETELTAEEKLIRAIFKEKAREVRDTSLKVPHGEKGVVIDVKEFSREAGDDLSPGVNRLVRVYVAKKRKIAEGDKLAGRHGNKGVISKIVPEEDMPFLEDGTPVDIILNPLGVPSRMNIGQVMETHLGWAAHHGFYQLKRNKKSMEGDPLAEAGGDLTLRGADQAGAQVLRDRR